MRPPLEGSAQVWIALYQRLLLRKSVAFTALLIALSPFTLAAALRLDTDEITWSAILRRLNYDHATSLTITLNRRAKAYIQPRLRS